MNNFVVQKFAEQLEPETDVEIQKIILILLTNVIGAGFEDLHRFGKDDEIENILQGQKYISWTEVDLLIKQLIELNPQKAFELAIVFLTLPENENLDLEWKYRYLRGLGLTILGNPKVIPLFSDFLQEEKLDTKVLLYDAIRLFMLDGSLRSLNKDEAFSTPEFYSMVAALRVAIQLGGSSSPLALNLFNHARVLISNKRIKEQLSWFLDLEDTKELAEFLLNYKSY